MYQEPEFSCEAMIQMLAVAFSLSRVPAIQVRVEASTSADGRVCFHRYFQELSERFQGGFDPDRSNPARDEDMTPPAGFFCHGAAQWLSGRLRRAQDRGWSDRRNQAHVDRTVRARKGSGPRGSPQARGFGARGGPRVDQESPCGCRTVGVLPFGEL